MEIEDVKIGMKVIGNDLADIAYLYTKKGWIGTVEAIRGGNIYVRGFGGGKNYSVNPKAFDKYNEGEERENLFNQVKRQVVEEFCKKIIGHTFEGDGWSFTLDEEDVDELLEKYNK